MRRKEKNEPKEKAVLPESEVALLIEQVKKELHGNQERVKMEVHYVKDRIDAQLESFHEEMEKARKQEQEATNTRGGDKRYLSHSNEWDYAVTGTLDLWKKEFWYLTPEYNTIMPRVQNACRLIENRASRQIMKQILNDYRRMYLHVQYIREVDANPKYLDDIKMWILSTSEEGNPPIFVDKRLKRILELSLTKWKDVKGLQRMTELIRTKFVDIASVIENQIHESRRRSLAAGLTHGRGSQIMLELEGKSMEEIAAILFKKFRKIQADFEEVNKIWDKLRGTISSLDSTIEDITKQIETAENEMESYSKDGNPVDKLRSKIKSNMEEFFKETMRSVESLVTALETHMDTESRDSSATSESQALLKKLKALSTKQGEKIAKQGLTPPSMNDDFQTSAMWKACTTNGLADIAKNVITKIDVFQSACIPTREMALSRLSSETKSLKDPQPLVTQADLSALRSGGGDDMTSAVLSGLKMCDKICQEFSRIIKDKRTRDMQGVLLKHQAQVLAIEVALKSVSMLKPPKADAGKRRRSVGAEGGKSKGKGGGKEGKAEKKKRPSLELEGKEETAGAGVKGKAGKGKDAGRRELTEDDDADSRKEGFRRGVETGQEKKGKAGRARDGVSDREEEGRGKGRETAGAAKKMARRRSTRSDIEEEGTEEGTEEEEEESQELEEEMTKEEEERRRLFDRLRDRKRSSRMQAELGDPRVRYLPHRRPSVAMQERKDVEPYAKPKPTLKFQFYSQGVPVFKNEAGEYVDYEGKELVPVTVSGPLAYGPWLRVNVKPPLSQTKSHLLPRRRW